VFGTRRFRVIGAGISRPAPAGLPTVDVLVAGILENIASAVPELRERLLIGQSLFLTAPFEVFMGVLEQGLTFRTTELLTPLTSGAPNGMHRSIAAMMLNQSVRAVITTNFDNLIERALGSARLRVPTAYDWTSASPCLGEHGSTCIVKVHGFSANMATTSSVSPATRC
jgi:NAD-dependent SIR2 family protein deacetylase